ncbi:MAG: glycosyltransferase family 4 protein [Flavobacteriales bacterium]|jgi:glycosyltransferase involved in cell wall biosynthesis|tara:strand:- start:116 stop:1177 length:1062 start_codon:yes stop_codon:yes gene_type:complete
MKKDVVLYISPSDSEFVKKDINFLNSHCKVIHYSQDWGNKAQILKLFLNQFFFLVKTVRKSDSIFIMFGGYWSFLPSIFGKIFNKRVYIILGGTDCVSFPSINYGSLRKKVLKKFIHWSYRMATRLLPVDDSLVFSENIYYENRVFNNQGFKYFFPKLKTPYSVINNGFNPAFFNGNINHKTQNSFISVALTDDFNRFKLKGIDKIFFLAKEFKDCSFTIVGLKDQFKNQLKSVPKNIEILSFLSQEDLLIHLNRSEFYLQLSISEGFPNALCEAMLCGCIPIGSKVGAIPKIIDNTGFLMESSNNNYIKKEFNKILTINISKRKELAKSARLRVENEFHIQNREDKFLDLIK